MPKGNLLICSLLLCFTISKGQSPAFNADLSTAEKIGVNKRYSFPVSPAGFGKIQEFPLDAGRSGNYFIKERNTCWHIIDIPYDGTFTFEIRPKSSKDDYDWMLFDYSNGIKKEESFSKLIRSNNSRNDEKIKGNTGLKTGYENLYEKPGPGKSFSKPLTVKRGQKLALIIDNIYNGGDGFELDVRLKGTSTVLLSGFIKDKVSGITLPGTVTVEDDSLGIFIGETKADSLNGYRIEIPSDINLNITATAEEHLYQTQNLKSNSADIKSDFLLDRIAAGNKLILFNLHFFPNKDALQPNSKVDLDRLIEFLQKEAEWNIKIIGHTNNNVFASARYLQQLSFKRAIAIKNILIKNGISEKRLSCFGMGGKYPLINTKDPVEGLRNLRVEVVLSGK
ncbi:OmpA family protein [Rubrolithibacter danxiaensis]|uniref:OmpA family protein n=1 Tax=Rubrolithibacter danxiaensis TaxID=3390805 RepID=UPI003BF7BC5B